MRIKILQNWRITLAFILMAVFVNWQIISAYTEPSESNYSRTHYASVYDAITAYHSKLNDLMNHKIEILVSCDPSKPEDCKQSMPEAGKKCEADNISTYCLAEEMVEEYIDFKSGLEDHAIYALDANDSEMVLTNISVKANARSRMITLEQENAIKILDTALAAYNELQIALPMHNSYLETISILKDYDSALIDFRDEVAEWESDFIDVSTTDCK